MAFSRMSDADKDAFFDLLDEYFTSRPSLLASLGRSSHDESTSNSATDPQKAVINAATRAMAANPAATASLLSAGLKHGVPKNSPYAPVAHDSRVAGGVASLAATFANKGFLPGQNQSPAPPPTTPSFQKRTPPSRADAESPPQVAPRPGSQGLLSGRGLANVDTASVKNAFSSFVSGKKTAPPAPAPAPAPAAPPPPNNSLGPLKKNSFQPPPRRLVSEAPVSRAREEPEPEPEEGEHEEGEWVEALYEYNSGESGDLRIEPGQRIKVIKKDSSDWWTGESNGERGLIPASYVKQL